MRAMATMMQPRTRRAAWLLGALAIFVGYASHLLGVAVAGVAISLASLLPIVPRNRRYRLDVLELTLDAKDAANAAQTRYSQRLAAAAAGARALGGPAELAPLRDRAIAAWGGRPAEPPTVESTRQRLAEMRDVRNDVQRLSDAAVDDLERACVDGLARLARAVDAAWTERAADAELAYSAAMARLRELAPPEMLWATHEALYEAHRDRFIALDAYYRSADDPARAVDALRDWVSAANAIGSAHQSIDAVADHGRPVIDRRRPRFGLLARGERRAAA